MQRVDQIGLSLILDHNRKLIFTLTSPPFRCLCLMIVMICLNGLLVIPLFVVSGQIQRGKYCDLGKRPRTGWMSFGSKVPSQSSLSQCGLPTTIAYPPEPGLRLGVFRSLLTARSVPETWRQGTMFYSPVSTVAMSGERFWSAATLPLLGSRNGQSFYHGFELLPRRSLGSWGNWLRTQSSFTYGSRETISFITRLPCLRQLFSVA